MSKKRIVAKILLIVMAMSLSFGLVGCGGDDDCPICGGSGYYEKKDCPGC